MSNDSATVITSKEGIELVKLASLKQRLRLEKAGMRCRPPSAQKVAKKRYGLPPTASIDSLLTRVREEMRELERVIVKNRLEHYDVRGKHKSV